MGVWWGWGGWGGVGRWYVALHFDEALNNDITYWYRFNEFQYIISLLL